MAELSVGIGADIKDFEKKIDKAEKDLIGFGKVSQKVGKGVGKFGSTAAKGAKGLDKFGKSTANAVPATQEFSRIIQDAPFGIQGVANNITQLTDQFGNLTRKTGSSGAALKAMISTLTGPAGILLAVSAVTSILVSYGDEIGALIRGNNALAESQKAVGKALDDFYGNQVTKINTYVSILEDANTEEAERKRITDELIKVVPNLTKADFEYGNNLDIVKGKIGKYVLAQASRIEADTLVEENSAKLSKRARVETLKNIDDQEKRIEAFTKFLKEEDIGVTNRVIDYKGDTSNIKLAVQKFVAKSDEEITTIFNQYADNLETELKPVQDRISELYGATFSGGLDKAEKSGKGLGAGKKTKISSLINLQTPEEARAEFDKYAQDVLSTLKDSFDIKGGLGAGLINVDAVNEDIKGFVKAFDPLKGKLQETSEATQIFADASSSAIGAAFGQIASDIDTGSKILDSFVSSIIGSLGQLLSQLIASSIKQVAANQAVATSAAIAGGAQSGAGTGPAAIFTTPGFIASLVAVVGGAFAAIPKFALGGYSGDNNLAMLNANELILRPMEQQALFNILKGGSIGNVGNSIPNDVGSEERLMSVIRGNDLHIISTRAGKKMSRFYNT